MLLATPWCTAVKREPWSRRHNFAYFASLCTLVCQGESTPPEQYIAHVGVECIKKIFIGVNLLTLPFSKDFIIKLEQVYVMDSKFVLDDFVFQI